MLLEESKFITEHIETFKPDYIFVDGSLILWGAKKINPPKLQIFWRNIKNYTKGKSHTHTPCRSYKCFKIKRNYKNSWKLHQHKRA